MHIENENDKYAQYNKEMVRRLQQVSIKKLYLTEFGQDAHQEAITAYGWVAQAFAEKELLAVKFLARKCM